MIDSLTEKRKKRNEMKRRGRRLID